jgi:uncharacterized protein (TIGR04255 family)
LRPLVTPLFEVSTELDFEFRPEVEFRAKSFHTAIAERCPSRQQFPLVLVPPDQLTPEQLNATPAVYRFHALDNKFSAFVGTRMVAANVMSWPGYPSYREFVENIIGLYLDLMDNPTPFRQSVGFYNRIPIQNIEEFNEILAQPPPLADDASLEGLVYQVNRRTSVGVALTQMLMRPPDQKTSEPFLAVNNIIQTPCDGQQFALGQLLNWLDQAHDVGKGMIWTMLSEQARSSWSKTGSA